MTMRWLQSNKQCRVQSGECKVQNDGSCSLSVTRHFALFTLHFALPTLTLMLALSQSLASADDQTASAGSTAVSLAGAR